MVILLSENCYIAYVFFCLRNRCKIKILVSYTLYSPLIGPYSISHSFIITKYLLQQYVIFFFVANFIRFILQKKNGCFIESFGDSLLKMKIHLNKNPNVKSSGAFNMSLIIRKIRNYFCFLWLLWTWFNLKLYHTFYNTHHARIWYVLEQFLSML